MLDRNVETDAKALDELLHYASSMHGINFALAMRESDGSVKVYPRSSQPCQGGEMRKYQRTHGDLCTRPNDRRPSDLHDPFPSGIVEAVGFHKSHVGEKFLRDSLSEDSPWLKGFNSPDNIIYAEKNGKTVGYIINDTEVDPTVLVNLAQYQNTCGPFYEKYLEAGFTRKEALVLVALFNHDPEKLGVQTYNYYFPVLASLDRFFEANPHDLSGGTYRNGFDYNRRDIHNLFKAGPGETHANWGKLVLQKGFPRYSQPKLVGYRLKDTYEGPLEFLPVNYYVSNTGLPKPEFVEAVKHTDWGYIFDKSKTSPTWEKYFEICRSILNDYYSGGVSPGAEVNEDINLQPEEVQHDEAMAAGL